MILMTKGVPLNIKEPLVGRVTRDPQNVGENEFLICENEISDDITTDKFRGILTNLASVERSGATPMIKNVENFDHLSEGDIVSINRNGNIRTLYRLNSFHNFLFATERCSSNCLMCSQPPKDKNDIPELYTINKQLITLIPKNCPELTITGGEPTLMGKYFFDTLELLKEQLPDTEIHVLTNGRSFAWQNMADQLAEIDYKRLMFGVPVYADYYQIHDYIVQAKNAFNQTILGLHNLARYNQRIEIRVVLHKQSIPRLTKLAKYIYKNLPFAEHVTFMGLEYIGYTPHNINQLWIDPYDYIEELAEAVEFLAGQGMHVSIYNLQLCVLPETLWQYSRKSISDWKNSYLPECEKCSKLRDCGGLFTWNLNKPSTHIRAFE